jgi:glutaconate CoA-transferase subunit B
MTEQRYTPDEIMTLAAARRLTNGTVCFVGIGIPSAAANLARLTHAPNVILIYESGAIGTKPDVLPLSIGDGELAETADAVVSVPEVFGYWLQGGRVDVGFLGAAKIDKYANINSTVIGDYRRPKVRLPGAGGAPEIASGAKEVCIILKQSKRTFVERVDFITTAGQVFVSQSAPRYRPRTVITDLCIMENDQDTGELILTAVHPGVTLEKVHAETGWNLRVADDLRETPVPTIEELTTLRDLQRRTAAAHSERLFEETISKTADTAESVDSVPLR